MLTFMAFFPISSPRGLPYPLLHFRSRAVSWVTLTPIMLSLICWCHVFLGSPHLLEQKYRLMYTTQSVQHEPISDVQSCQVEVVEFLESFQWSTEADAIQWGGVSSRIFPWSPRAYVVQWGGGVVAGFFRDLLLRNQILTRHLSDIRG